jgi:hypothetical protein
MFGVPCLVKMELKLFQDQLIKLLESGMPLYLLYNLYLILILITNKFIINRALNS